MYKTSFIYLIPLSCFIFQNVQADCKQRGARIYEGDGALI